MKAKKGKSGPNQFRVANGELIPNLGEAEIKGQGSLNGDAMRIHSQVATVTKPLAAATEAVDTGHMVILHKTGGIVKKLSHETEKKIRDLIKAEKGSEVILERKGHAFTFGVDVHTEERQSEPAREWAYPLPKKAFKPQKRQLDDNRMEVDTVTKNMRNRFDAMNPLWEQEQEIECRVCCPFHRP